MSQKPESIRVRSISLVSVTGENPRCTVTIAVVVDGVERKIGFESSERGIGPVSVICGAFREIVPDFGWKDFRAIALAAGENADAQANVTITKDGGIFHGQGVHFNTLQATACAVAEGVHKLRFHEWNKNRHVLSPAQ